MGIAKSSSLSKNSTFLVGYLRNTPLVEGALAITAVLVPYYCYAFIKDSLLSAALKGSSVTGA